MPQVIGNFLEEHPKCSLHINTMQSNLSYKAVENKDADLGLITNPHFFKKVQTIPLFEEQLVFVCGGDAPYQDGLLPSQLDSADESIFHGAILSLCGTITGLVMTPK